MFVNTLLVASLCQNLANALYESEPASRFSETIFKSFGVAGVNATYDYVVIGGGTAGNAIASRLAENRKITVAVIEAGGFYEIESGNRSVVPGLAPVNTQDPLTDWGFFTEPMSGAKNRSLHYPRGRTLGGSSALNYMVYQRGTRGSFQLWADQVGDQSYTYDRILPYFKKSATYFPPNEALRQDISTVTQDLSAFDNSLHGPVQVGLVNNAPLMHAYGLKAMALSSIPTIPGLNSGYLHGAAWCISSVDQKYQHRSSSQNSYLAAAMDKTTIQIYTHALAKQIIFDGKKTATAVKVQTGASTYFLHANKEIILAGGAINSPQLLMVSGVGPRTILERLSIPVISELSGVGQGMWDHNLFDVTFEVSVDTSTKLFVPTAANKLFQEAQALAYQKNASGLYTTVAGVLGWEKLPRPLRSTLKNSTTSALTAFPPDWPEIEYLMQNGYPGSKPINPNSSYASLGVGIVAPVSRGYVSINSTDTADAPIINPNYFGDPAGADIDLAIAGLKRAREIWSHMPPNITVGEEFEPGPAVQTDAEIADFIRGVTSPIFHVACSCKMGKEGDKTAVVDSRARVFGVKSLRVVDASSFNVLPPGHPQSAVYMLAEKIADEIKNGR